MRQQNFEKFYYSKVALGEGCGCAERVIDNHEIERIRGQLGQARRSGPGPLKRLFARIFTRKSTTEPGKD